MNQQTTPNSDRNILVGIGVVTIVVVLVIWAGSKPDSGNGANATTAPAPQTDSMEADHHSTSRFKASTALLDALVGKPVPEFSLKDKDGNEYSSKNLKGKTIILFFNEGLMCYPACWEQIVQLATDSRLNDKDIVSLSVVVDSPQEWQRAVEKMPELSKAIVVFDTGSQVSSRFGTLTTPSSMHFGALPGHTYVVVGPDGIVRYVYDDPRMAIHNDQLAEVLAKK